MCDLISKQLLGVSIATALIFTATGCDSSSTTTKISRQALPESIQISVLAIGILKRWKKQPNQML